MRYKRILLKVSGEALMGGMKFGHDPEAIQRICKDIAKVHAEGVQISIVVGGGNIFRGSSAESIGMERASADYMGMLGTVINALALQSCMEKLGVATRVVSAIPMTTICEPYIRRRAIRHMEKGRVVIFAAGTGNPFFTTDTAATLRAIEMSSDVIMKGTQVDGIYSSDPRRNQNAAKYSKLSYKEVLAQELQVMDTSAIALARENHIPIIVFSLHEENMLLEIINGKGSYTIVEGD